MDASFRWGQGPGLHSHVLEALETLVAQPVATSPEVAVTRGLSVVCRLAARLAGAPVAGHVRYDVPHRTCRLLLWRSTRSSVTILQVEPELRDGRQDWWTPSRSRLVLMEWMDRPHLAELPLSTEPAEPTLVVVGRDEPFGQDESDVLAGAHRSLRVLEQLVTRIVQPRALGDQVTEPGRPRLPLVSDLTTREREVLEMLSEGLMARSIAQRLMVSERTVHKHLGNVYRKLDAHDRLLAVRRAKTLGLIPEEMTAEMTAEAPGGPARTGW